MLGHQHLGEQGRRGDALVDHRRGNRGLHQRAARRAAPLAANVALHGEHTRRVVEFLCDILAHPLQRLAAAAGGVLGFVVHVSTRQPLGQGCALGLLALRIAFGLSRQRGLQGGQLLVDGGDVAVHRLVEQHALLAAHLLAAAVELQALELGELEGEFVDLCVTPDDLMILAFQQLQGKRSQLLDIEFIELVAVNLRDVDH